jgi:hypothetical protein
VSITRSGIIAVHQMRGGKVCPWSARVYSECPSAKVCYASEDEADLAAASLTRANLKRSRPGARTAARSYKCERCSSWHTTSLPPMFGAPPAEP